jgi:hypothetical protein
MAEQWVLEEGANHAAVLRNRTDIIPTVQDPARDYKAIQEYLKLSVAGERPKCVCHSGLR